MDMHVEPSIDFKPSVEQSFIVTDRLIQKIKPDACLRLLNKLIFTYWALRMNWEARSVNAFWREL